MKQVLRRRSDYPQVSCIVPSCSATTRTIPPPYTAMICRKCWRRAPKRHGDFHARIQRRLTLAKRRNSPDVARFERLRDYAFARVERSLLDQPAGEELPPLLQEELRKLALV